MDVQARYQTVLQELEKGGRALQRYTPTEVQELQALLQKREQLVPVLCLVTHAAYPDRTLEPVLLDLLAAPLAPDELVYVLNAARKHIIEARFKEGQRLDITLLDRLRLLLQHKDPSVVEWTLRTIEECGTQSVYLAKDVHAVRPSVFSLFRAHNRTILELVTLLERRWGTSESQKR